MSIVAYVYVFKSGPFYKIGYTTNIEKRLSVYRWYNPSIKIVHIIKSYNALKLEHQLHLQFATKNACIKKYFKGNGTEWFKLGAHDKYVLEKTLEQHAKQYNTKELLCT